jgi:PKD repeat protein
LNITDNITGDTIAKEVEYKVDLENFSQPLIFSPESGNADKSIAFEGNISDLKDIRITDFFWDFGDGFKQGGPKMTHSYEKKGEYTVRLGLLEEKDSSGVVKKICVMKKIKIN